MINQQVEDIEFVIKSRKYQDSDFNQSQANLKHIVDWFTTCQINHSNLKHILAIYQYFGLPFIYSMQQFYKNLTLTHYRDFQKLFNEIILLTMFFTNGFIPKELEFIKIVQITGKYQNRKKTKKQQQFYNYWKKIQDAFEKLKKQQNRDKIQQLIIQFFQKIGDSINFNFFQTYFIQIYTDGALKLLSIHQKPQIQQSNMQIQIPLTKKNIDPRLEFQNQMKKPICCRKFFIKNEILDAPQSLILQYKNYNYPYNQDLIHQIKKVICGFLNRNGGTIIIGVKQQSNTRKRIVIGDIYDQNKMQQIHKFFKFICSDFYPQIIMDMRYSIKFVPIKNSNNQFILGNYIIKVTIKYGLRDQVYSFRQKRSKLDEDFFYFRTQNEVLRKLGRQACIQLKNRLKNPLQIPKPLHPQECDEPELGKRLFKNERYMQQIQSKNKNDMNNKGRNNNNNLKQKIEIRKENNIKYEQQNKKIGAGKKIFVENIPLRNFILKLFPIKFLQKIFKGVSYKFYRNYVVDNEYCYVSVKMEKQKFQKFKDKFQDLKNSQNLIHTYLIIPTLQIQFRGYNQANDLRTAALYLKSVNGYAEFTKKTIKLQNYDISAMFFIGLILQVSLNPYFK